MHRRVSKKLSMKKYFSFLICILILFVKYPIYTINIVLNKVQYKKT